MLFTDPDFITCHIPHRPPFLWLDRVVSLGENEVICEQMFPPDLDLFAGHYPDYPLVPGVILCEAAFQAGALLLAVLGQQMAGLETNDHHGTPKPQTMVASEPLTAITDQDFNPNARVPVLTRIMGAKFKRQVRPGDQVTIQVKLHERLSNAWFLKGIVRVAGRVAVKVEFACAMTT